MKCCNRKNQDIHISLYTSSRALPANWTTLLPAGHFLLPERFAVYERMALPDMRFAYALIEYRGVPVAAAYFQLLSLQQTHVDMQRLGMMQRLSMRCLSLLRPVIMVAGHLFRHDVATVYYADSLSDYDAFRCYSSAIRQVARQFCAMAVLVKDMPEALAPYFRHYAPEYLLLRNDISMEMSLPESWRTVDDYVQSLKHKYAQRYRKIKTSWHRLTIKELDVSGTISEQAVLFGLYQQVSNHQQVRLGRLSESFLPELKKQYPDRLRIWMVYEDGKPVAFFSAWVLETMLDMFYIGFDYARNQELNLYFNILFFGVEQAVLLQKSRLVMGRTALEAKARLGCRPRYLSTYVYIRNRLLRTIVTQFRQAVVQEEGAWENRHPFRQAGGDHL